MPSREEVYWYRIEYAREGRLSFLSQRELQRVFERALRRKRLPLAFSRGFNPRPKLSFGRALPVGIASEKEVFFVGLSEEIPEGKLLEALGDALPEGLMIREVSRVEAPEEIAEEAEFEIRLPPGAQPLPEDLRARMEEPLVVERPSGERSFNLKEWIKDLSLKDGKLLFTLRLSPGAPRPEEVATHLLRSTTEEILTYGVKKVA